MKKKTLGDFILILLTWELFKQNSYYSRVHIPKTKGYSMFYRDVSFALEIWFNCYLKVLEAFSRCVVVGIRGLRDFLNFPNSF